MTTIRTPKEVYDFWFVRCGRELWFRSTPELDVEIREGFRETHLALAADVGAEWRAGAESRLAAVIVLDQFPRNIYRGTALAVATDGLALREAKLALASGADRAVEAACRTFFYMPFEHAEDLGEQERSVELFGALGDAEYLDYAIRHRDVIAAYGRFPHRNAMLGRESTAAERDYLSGPDAGF
ncbi:DUF924 family protein [Rhizobium johnstonii]|uniref:DUF924 family protein n=1 Tax=Rhizobium TaxID=379 RepID=UPI0003FB1BFF|nr:DUF924 family protein [Rhizobium leguminosarum]MBY5339429.1 DUF924 domain-containing protein [Rhizobium leguminosarum]MBY5414107.1 DUF924 domain-containing protein [Rhizobium leguminosarum]NEI53699.1 DUF924 family protein [Rhizobium leguminosarum]NEI82805.1 DUF924 family protein [Rhizobium leguminosarum]NKK48333.1 DUF924 family protein [Rhizobium leguminosarum bv. viciae]